MDLNKTQKLCGTACEGECGKRRYGEIHVHVWTIAGSSKFI